MNKIQQFARKAALIIGNMWRPSRYGNTIFYPTNFNCWNDIKYLETFNEVPEINAIINLKGRCHSKGIIKAVNDKGEEQESKIVNTLKRPNWFQNGPEFKRQTKMFHEIFGNEFLYQLFPVGFNPASNIAGTKSIFTLPPNLVDLEYCEKQPFYVFSERPEGVKYLVDFNGLKVELDNHQIIHYNDNRVNIASITDKHLLTGESKMKALTACINNIRMAYESRGVILKNRGALGILSNNTNAQGIAVPLKEKEIEDIQRKYQNYGGLEHQNQLIITSSNLKWQQMAVNPDKLGLYQECEEDFFKFCDAYGTPMEMFSSKKGLTYENQKEAEKGMYIKTVIPEAAEWIDGLNQVYYPEEKGKVKLIMTFDHLPIFQEDLKFRGEALEKMVNSLSKMLADGAIDIAEYQAELQKFGIGKNIKL